ncbi:sensor histidine kinase [Paraburkholderia humisilvae]|nr:HAMP domain-containing sensor histidine kinase [Paraburkholderia humisilvae]
MYGSIFAVSVMLLLGFMSWVVTGEMERQNDLVMDWQLKYFDAIPRAQLAKTIGHRVERERMHNAYYGLFRADGEPLAGDVTRLPPGMRTDRVGVTLNHTLPVNGTVDVPVVRAMADRRRDGDVMLVARDLTYIIRIRDTILNALLLSSGLCLAAGVAGGLALAMRQMRRVGEIRRVTQLIAQGDLNQRLPVGRRDELDLLSHLVNHMLDEVERLMTEVKGACDGIAHDLRTPLAHVRTLLAHIDENAQDDTTIAWRPMLVRAREETDHLLERFRAMMRISEIGTLKRRGGFAQIRLEALVRDVCELYEPLAESRSIALSVDTAAVQVVHGDRALLFEALSNLLDNALKFTPAGGAVCVSLAQTRDGPQVDVIDNGPGIPVEERHAVMQRFYRGEQTRHIAGSGLGLGIVSAVLRVHDFSASIGSAEPGTRVTVECWPHTLA